MFTTRPWWVVKKTPSGLRGEFQRVPLILLICFPHSSFCNIHYALKTAGKQEHGLLWGSKERGLREAGRENERKTQHIYSTGLNGALQFEHNTWTVAGRRTGGKWWWRWWWWWRGRWKSELYRDVRCLARVVVRFEHESAGGWLPGARLAASGHLYGEETLR